MLGEKCLTCSWYFAFPFILFSSHFYWSGFSAPQPLGDNLLVQWPDLLVQSVLVLIVSKKAASGVPPPTVL